MKTMNNKKILALQKLAYIGLVLLFVFITLITGIKKNVMETVPEILEYRLPMMTLPRKADDLLYYEDIGKMRSDLKDLAITGYSVEYDSIGTLDGKKANVRLYYVDSRYSDMYDMHMIHGFFDNSASSIVIGQELATKLFMTEQVLGIPMIINGKEYTISGVYQEEDSWLSQASTTKEPAVYIPFLSQPKEFVESTAIQVVAMDSKKLFLGEETAGLLENIKNKMLLYNKVHYSEKVQFYLQWDYILMMIILLTSVVLVIQIMQKIFRNFYEQLVIAKGSYYFSEALKEVKKPFLFFLLKVLGMAGVISILFFIAQDRFIWPAQYLSRENIFDFEFYYEAFIKNMQNKNSRFYTDAAYYLTYIHNAAIILFIMLSASIGVITMTLRLLWTLLIREDMQASSADMRSRFFIRTDSIRCMIGIGMALALGVILGNLILNASSLPSVIPMDFITQFIGLSTFLSVSSSIPIHNNTCFNDDLVSMERKS